MMRKHNKTVIHPLFYFAEACVVGRWLRDAAVDHMHAHFGTNSADVAMLAHLITGVPYSFAVHGPAEFDRPEELGLDIKISYAAFVCAISSFTRSQLYRWCRERDWRKIHLIRCGLDRQFTAVPDGVEYVGKRFVCVARMSVEKGPFMLVEVARRLAEENRSFQVIFVGDGPMREKVEGRIAEYGLGDKVLLAGWLDARQVRDQIVSSRCLVLPSFAEGLPVVVMEALASERPVIASCIAGIPELIENGKSGWLVTAGSVEELTNAMRECLEADDARILAMGSYGRDRVLELHNVDTECARLAALFRASRLTQSAPVAETRFEEAGGAARQ
jgi:glycosyltransferase involved in cell wall biosynthesis